MKVEIISALTLGVLGSMHCIGMCGPIALVLPINRSSYFTMLSGAISYNIGRVLTYAIIGFIFGLIGQKLFIGEFQRYVSIGLGVLIIISAVIPGLVTKYFNVIPLVAKATNQVKNSLSGLIKSKSLFALLIIGLLNGLLPCGLVYVALAAALVTGDMVSGATYMAFFGLGTIPVMMALPMIGKFISVSFRNKLMKVFPIILILFGLLFILRGMNLGIPFISPVI